MTQAKVFTIPAILDGFRPLKDGGASLTFHTQELSQDDKVEIMGYYNSFGFVAFSKNEINTSDLPKGNANDDTGKSPSQRIRAVLFVMWTQKGSSGDFEVFYKQQMERFIDRIKEELS